MARYHKKSVGETNLIYWKLFNIPSISVHSEVRNSLAAGLCKLAVRKPSDRLFSNTDTWRWQSPTAVRSWKGQRAGNVISICVCSSNQDTRGGHLTHVGTTQYGCESLCGRLSNIERLGCIVCNDRASKPNGGETEIVQIRTGFDTTAQALIHAVNCAS